MGKHYIQTPRGPNFNLRVAKAIVDLKPEILGMVSPERRQLLSMAISSTQNRIAADLGISQPNVRHHVLGTLKRCQGFNDLTKPSVTEVRAATSHLDKETQNVALAMFQYGHQSQSAKSLGRSQGYVRHRFRRALQQIEDPKVGEWLLRHTVVEPMWSVVELKWFKFLPKKAPSAAALQRKARSWLQGENVEGLAPEQAWEYV